MRFSNRTFFAESKPSDFFLLIEEKRRKGVFLWDLTQSNPTQCGFLSLTADILGPLRDPENLIYTPDPKGLLKAREAVSDYYAAKGIVMPPDRIFLTSGTSEAY